TPIPVQDPASSVPQSIAEVMAAVLAQQTQLLTNAIEAGFQKLALQSAAQFGTDRVQPGPIQSSPARQRQSFEQLFGLLDRVDGNRPNPTPGIHDMLCLPAQSQQTHALRPDRISQIIYNWKLRFSGHSSITIDEFLY
ncbi:hypothetical protein KR044_007440, partial [Drosophila immigrans]